MILIMKRVMMKMALTKVMIKTAMTVMMSMTMLQSEEGVLLPMQCCENFNVARLKTATRLKMKFCSNVAQGITM